MLNHILDDSVRQYGSREALVFGEDRYNYTRLREMIERCAAGFEMYGANNGHAVALLLKNSPEFVFALLGAARLGVPALLLDPGFKTFELRRIFSENRLAAAVCEPELLPRLEEVRALSGQRFPIFVRGGSFAALLQAPAGPSVPHIRTDQIATVQYSSGSTGIPKCVARSHQNLYWEAVDFNETTKVSAEDRFLCTIPLFHAHGLGNAFLASLYAGATLVLTEEFNRAAVLELLERERITVFPAVPFIFDVLVRYVRGETSKPKHRLHLVFSAGAPLAPEISQGFHQQFGVYIRQLYGSTEVGSASINLEADIDSTLESVGRPMKNVRIEIFREDGSPTGQDEVGEVAIQSSAMPAGYLRQPELTLQKFRDGFYWTGDLGRRSSRGLLYLTGRGPWLVSSSGEKVDPQEVEAVIAAYPKVKDVVVVGVPGHLGEQVVKAVVVPHESCLPQEIVSYCRDKLADFKIPRLVQFVREIPRSPSGKILRKDLIV